MYEKVVVARQRVLGSDHPDTLSTRNNLAVAYRLVGRFDEAIHLYEVVLAEGVQALGPDHPRHPDLSQQPCRRPPEGRPNGQGH
jgi:hypothetical protein